jgi:hypothetical protein
MNKIASLLAPDFSKPIHETVNVDNLDPDTVFAELTEYIATDRITAEYEGLLSAMAAALKSPAANVGVWISGSFGCGKSSFVKNLGYILANREVKGDSARALFLKRVESQRVTESVELLNRAAPCQVFMFDVESEMPVETKTERITDGMYRVLLRDLDYAEDFDLAEMEIELEKESKLAAFEDLCRSEFREDWRTVRKGGHRLARASSVLHRLAPQTYPSPETWLNLVKARPARSVSVKDLVERSFELCELRRPGKAFVFILDELDQYVALVDESLETLHAILEQFGKESARRLKAGRIPGPVWIVVTVRNTLDKVHLYLTGNHMGLPELREGFERRIDLSRAGIQEVAARRVLGKKESGEPVLRKLFHDYGARLIENVKLERSGRRTKFDEEQFVRYYPYLPHLVDLSIEIMDGIRRHPHAPKHLAAGNGPIVKQCAEMLLSPSTRLADQPVGVLVSIDKIYDLLEPAIPPEKQKDIRDIRERFDNDQDYPGMAGRVAQAICLMELVYPTLPRTPQNLAALLIQRVTEAPPRLAVESTLIHLQEANFVRETENGWNLYGLDELRTAPLVLDRINQVVGTATPRYSGLHNDLIQVVKKLMARSLSWYTRPLREFNSAVSRSLGGVIWSLDHLAMNLVAVDKLSANLGNVDQLTMDLVALEARLAQSEKRNAALAEELIRLQQTAAPAPAVEDFPSKTTYVIGLFGTGRRYINELLEQNLGARAKYLRDTIRLHPGPTPMIYSGHATIQHVSRAQELPSVMSRILEAVRSGYADLIFVYRHPLDSLLTNWVWWRTYLRDNRAISGISQLYKNIGDLSDDLEDNFAEFKVFAAGNSDFFQGSPGPPFLSFAEFVQETELHLRNATLSLRLEDFMIDPAREFSKILKVMGADVDPSRLQAAPPRTKPYGHLLVEEKVPQFRDFVDGLDRITKERIEKIGYQI